MFRRVDVCLGSLLAVGVVTLALVAPYALADGQVVWSGQSGFLAGTLIDTDASSQPGRLVLAEQPSNWTRYANNPVLGPSQSWDADWVAAPDVHYDGGIYKMWYQGCIGQTCEIGYATSTDGTAWTPYSGNPVLLPDPSGWDSSVGIPKVIHDGSVYRMWYLGNGPLAIRIGYATSSDGVHWVKYSNLPVFNGTGTWDAAAVSTPAVVLVGSTFVLYFSGHSGDYVYRMGRATSPDGINWTESPGNPVMSPTEAWEDSRVHPGTVSYSASGYELYYTGGPPGGLDEIGHATSADGVNFTKDAGNPIFHAGEPGSWDGTAVAHPDVVQVGTQLQMYYTGYNQSLLQIGFANVTPGGVTYASAGTWSSPVVDSSNPDTTWFSVSWVGTTPANTGIGASVQVGNSSVPDVTWTLSPPSVSTPVLLHVPKARYARVIIALVSLDASRTPSLESVSLTFAPPTSPGPPAELLGLTTWGFALLLLVVATGVATVVIVLLVASRGRAPAPPANAPRSLPTCPQCGAVLPAGNRFCGRCGYRLPPSGGGGPPGS